MQIQNNRSHINDKSKPVIFIGSSQSILELTEVCDFYNIPVHGIIDQDYYGNTDTLSDIPVIDTETSFSDYKKLQYYRDNFNFFCATNWMPNKLPVHERNRKKRMQQLQLLDDHKFNVISLVHHMADVSKHAVIGHGVYVDAFASIEPGAEISDFVSIYSHCIVGHHAKLGRNSVFQRRTSLSANTTYGKNVYFGLLAAHFKTEVVVSDGTFVHEGVCFQRGTVEDEVISLDGGNLKRVYDLRFSMK
jgi:hypothetical protein